MERNGFCDRDGDDGYEELPPLYQDYKYASGYGRVREFIYSRRE